MVSPNISKITNGHLTVNLNTKKLFQVIYQKDSESEEVASDEPKLKVSEVISKMAFYYEKIRNSVDYKEEYLLRKNAIDRILKRHIMIEGVIKTSSGHEISTNLLHELIRAGYLPNNKIPEKKVDSTKEIIEKYIKLRNFVIGYIAEANERSLFAKWLIAIMASEIEESLGRDKEKKIVISNMYEYLKANIALPPDLPYDKDLDIQIYLEVYKNYLKFDDDMLSFILFKYYNENWQTIDDDGIKKLADNIINLKFAIDNQLVHPISRQLRRIVMRYNVFYQILTEAIKEDPSKVYSSIKNDPKAFPRLIKQECVKKFKSLKKKLWRSALRSIIYIFITKSIVVFILEVPVSRLLGETVNPVALAINIVFPALLLYLVVLFTKVSSDDNTKKIIEGVNEISFKEHERTEAFVIRQPKQRSKLSGYVFGTLYTLTFLFSISVVVRVLLYFGFNFVNIVIFLFFLAFVSFFSIRIRRNIKDYIVVEPKENLLSFLIDFFYIPIVSVGKWLSEKFDRLNVFVFVLDFIIEAPFKIFVEIAEEWTKYVKERKDEIV